MTQSALRVLQISSAVSGGGAERVATDLHSGLLKQGHQARLVVGHLGNGGSGIQEMPAPATSGAERQLRQTAERLLQPLAGRGGMGSRLQTAVAEPGAVARWLDRRRGREAFEYPGSRRLLDVLPWVPDVIHCHNLHGAEFDLRQLPELSTAAPVMLTLHDEWLFTGHCAYSLRCERWRHGCGACPDLSLYPSTVRDATRRNRHVKESIYSRSMLYVSAPSKWLLDRARESVLATSSTQFRLIRNGVDRSVFNPEDRDAARSRLGITANTRVLMFAANRGRSSPYKDHQTVADAARRLASKLRDRPMLLLALGESGPIEQGDGYEVRPLQYEREPARMADHYRAADLYLHAAHAEAAGLTIIEAMSCGTPVVATAVGGIPEYVRGLRGISGAIGGSSEPASSATGVLVPEGDPASMAEAAGAILQDRQLSAQMAENAVADVVSRATLNRQVDNTVNWYRDAIEDWRARQAGSSIPTG